jgi:predicted dehydrogenase
MEPNNYRQGARPVADCLDNGTRPLPSAARARHVLEIMLAAQTAAATGQTIRLATSFEH